MLYSLESGTSVAQISTRVPFSDLPRSSIFVFEQFWGRAARALWIRENPDARLSLCGNVIGILLFAYELVTPSPILNSRKDKD
jgi:hypothetical protein